MGCACRLLEVSSELSFVQCCVHRLRLVELLAYDKAAALLWAWTTQPRPSWRQSRKEAIVLCGMFATCGSSSMKAARRLVDPAVVGQSALTAAIVRVFATTLIYPIVLLLVGTMVGRQEFCTRLLGRHCRGHRKAGSSRTRDVAV